MTDEDEITKESLKDAILCRPGYNIIETVCRARDRMNGEKESNEVENPTSLEAPKTNPDQG